MKKVFWAIVVIMLVCAVHMTGILFPFMRTEKAAILLPATLGAIVLTILGYWVGVNSNKKE